MSESDSSSAWWMCVVSFIAGAVCGSFLSAFVAREEMNSDMLCSPSAPSPSIGDFNLVPVDCEDVVISNPAVRLYRNGEGRCVVAMMVDEDSGEPYHFQAIGDDTRLYDLDVEFSADRRIFEHGLGERVEDVFEKLRNKPTQEPRQ